MLAIAPIAGVIAAVGLAALYPTLGPVVKVFWPKLAGDLNVPGCQVIPGEFRLNSAIDMNGSDSFTSPLSLL